MIFVCLSLFADDRGWYQLPDDTSTWQTCFHPIWLYDRSVEVECFRWQYDTWCVQQRLGWANVSILGLANVSMLGLANVSIFC